MNTAAPNVVPLEPNRLRESDYDRERQQIRETYGDSSKEAVARRDQALAALFYRSGWTQEELAKKEGKSPQWIARRVKFGCFLNFSPFGENVHAALPKLTEGSFRKYWEQTDSTGNERMRFLAVLKMLEGASLRRQARPPIGDAIVAKFGDGQWHSLAAIKSHTDAEEDHVLETLNTMKAKGSFGVTNLERKQVGKSWSYRIFRKARMISSDELAPKLDPIIAELKEQGKRNSATFAIGAVAVLAAQLEQLRNEWCK